MALTLLALAAILAALVAGQARGAEKMPDLAELEVKVWTADEQDLPKIEKELVRAIQIDPYSVVAHHLLSRTMARMFSRDPGELYSLKQASDLAQQAIELDPSSDAGYVALADILDLMGNAPRGIALLDQAVAAGLKPTWRVHFTRARLTADDAKTETVLKALEIAIAAPGAERRIIAPYVVALLQADSSGEKLVRKLEAWNHRFPSPLFTLTLAITRAEFGEHAAAHALYQEILAKDPQNREAMVNDGILLYRHLKTPALGVKMLEEALSIHGGEFPLATRAMVSAHLGAAYLGMKQNERAHGSFVRALTADSSLSLIDFVTKAHRDSAQHKDLVTLIRELNDHLPGSGILHAILGETLSEQLADHDGAVRAFSDAIVLEPARSDYYNGMGLALYRKKSFDMALKLFAAATEVDPNDATARYNEACVLAILGRADEALASLGEAVALDPRLVKTARGDGDFANIRSNMRFRQLIDQTAVGH